MYSVDHSAFLPVLVCLLSKFLKVLCYNKVKFVLPFADESFLNRVQIWTFKLYLITFQEVTNSDYSNLHLNMSPVQCTNMLRQVNYSLVEIRLTIFLYNLTQISY
jgi:hypothetical protein